MNFFKEKTGKKKAQIKQAEPSRSAISPKGRMQSVMRMQGRTTANLAALLPRLELKKNLKNHCRIQKGYALIGIQPYKKKEISGEIFNTSDI